MRRDGERKSSQEGADELSEYFNISKSQIYILLKREDSPSFPAGPGIRARWLCFPSKFEKYLQEMGKKKKG